MLVKKDDQVINLNNVVEFTKKHDDMYFYIHFYFNVCDSDGTQVFTSLLFSSEKMLDCAFGQLIDMYEAERNVCWLDEEELI